MEYQQQNTDTYQLLLLFEPVIEDLLIPSCVIGHMPSMAAFAHDIVKTEERGRKDAAKQFLHILKDHAHSNVSGWYAEFRRALEENGFEIILNLLENFREAKDQKFYKLLISIYYEKLVDVRPLDIMPKLISKGALDTNDSEIIRKCEENKGRKVSMMRLIEILTRKKEDWCQHLIDALKEGGWEDLASEMVPEIRKIRDTNEAIEQFEKINTGSSGGPSNSYDKNDNSEPLCQYMDYEEEEMGTQFCYTSEHVEMPLETAISSTLSSGESSEIGQPPETKRAIVRPVRRTHSYPNPLELHSNTKKPRIESTSDEVVDVTINHNSQNTVVSPASQQTNIPASACKNLLVNISSPNLLSADLRNSIQDKFQLSERKELNIPYVDDNSVYQESDLLSNVDNTTVADGLALEPSKDIKLRGYQLELAADAIEGKNVIIVAPTGSGKTHVAMHITKEHLNAADLGDEPKIMFMVPTIALVTQQKTAFKKYLPRCNIVGLSSDDQDLPLNEILPNNSIIVLTPAILLDALIEKNVFLSNFTLLIFDECHHTTKGHPYNDIMGIFIEQKLDPDQQCVLPQVIGLTASVGVGKAKTQQKAQEHILRLMANLDADKLCTVNDVRNKLELAKHVNRPGESTEEVCGRQRDPFRERISSLMKKIENKMKTCPEVDLADREVQGFRRLLEAPSQRGSQQYTQWLSKLDRPIAKIYLQTTRRPFFAYCRRLKAYNNALLINSDCRTKDAWEYLLKEVKEQKGTLSDETDKWLEKIFRDEEEMLKALSNDPSLSNPKLEKVKGKLLELFMEKPDSRAIIFVKTREMTKALVNWMKETPELVDLNAFNLTGSNATSSMGGMTQNKQDDVMKYFRDGKHKVIVATSVAEEGLDIQKCNLVIRYEHVTNEIAMVQTRGRGRDEDSQYVVLGEQGGGIMQREQNNKIKEAMMAKAVKEIQEMKMKEPKKLKDKLDKFQLEAKLERHMKAQGKQTEEEIRQARQDRGEYQLRCIQCDALAAFSSDFRRIENSHHVVMDPEFEQRIKISPHPKAKIYGQIDITKKISCNQCNYDWGVGALYKKASFWVLKLVSFRLIDPHDKSSTCKKWKDAPFAVEELSPEDLSRRLELMATETDVQSAGD